MFDTTGEGFLFPATTSSYQQHGGRACIESPPFRSFLRKAVGGPDCRLCQPSRW